MKYFKPDLLARSRSLDDDVAGVAAQEWDQATEAYHSELAAIPQALPRGVHRILDHYTLHDAIVLGISEAGAAPLLSLFIQLERRARRRGRIVKLTCRLAEGPSHRGIHLVKHDDTPVGMDSIGRIQYDEFSLFANEPLNVFTHSLLLPRHELQIRFIDLKVHTQKAFIVPSVELAGLEAAM